MRKRREAEVFQITGARQSLEDDVRGRQRRYVISMLIRTASVLLTVLLWNVERPLAVVTLVVGALLPYVAVVVANAGRENPSSMPSAFVPTHQRPALTASDAVPEADGRAPDGASGDRS
ncbi:DUF3099 domain-containing protein [Streptomyces sp. HNM0575]|uniref:DUF3099 domain-containing protein n=1 Tax=Streptomyces sp. HNM0575 TaxID=2716338 RepID=UPI00145E366D|nr:DUF3099 domain-containing protein [Streptomyces sp. HNM0575]NLU74790.1 DUF3099 domain-containing protein [Streptomyces sp. HNM0575]